MKVMRATTGWAIGLVLLLAACGTPDPFHRTEIGKKRIAIYQSRTLEDAITQPEKDVSFEGQLGDAAFALTQGMEAGRAMRRFEADGATCSGTICRWITVHREPAFPCGVPPTNLVSMCIRPPGPRQTYQSTREVTLLAPHILNRGDISARSESRTVPDRH
ncbi:MAG: hypothetical protein ACK4GC_16250 [Paracoccaceae bacterium]